MSHSNEGKLKILVVRNEAFEIYERLLHSHLNEYIGDYHLEYSDYLSGLLDLRRINDFDIIIIWLNSSIFSPGWMNFISKLFKSVSDARKLGIVADIEQEANQSRANRTDLQHSAEQFNLRYIQVESKSMVRSLRDTDKQRKYEKALVNEIGQLVCFYLRLSNSRALAVDFDGTLYGGIVGEDSSVVTGEDYFEVRVLLKDLSNSGILLTGITNNNPNEVQSLLDKNVLYPLKKHDFVSILSGWQPKVERMKKLLEILNFSEDYVIFVDDKVEELNLMTNVFPRVLTLPAKEPTQLLSILNFIRNMKERNSFLNKEETIHQSELRKFELQQRFERGEVIQDSNNMPERAESLADLLVKCGTQISCKQAQSPQEIGRALELFKKTNQFNFSSTRTLEIGEYDCVFVCTVKDDVIDSGIIAALLLKASEDGQPYVEEFVISCRALGRGLETYIFSSFWNKLMCNNGMRAPIQFKFKTTEKNLPVQALIKLNKWPIVEDGKFVLTNQIDVKITPLAEIIIQ